MIGEQFVPRNKAEFRQVFVQIHTTRLPTIKENRELQLKQNPLLRKHCLKIVIVLIFLLLGISVAIYAAMK